MLQLMQTCKRWYKAGVETMQEQSTNANKSLGKQLTAAVWLAMQQAKFAQPSTISPFQGTLEYSSKDWQEQWGQD